MATNYTLADAQNALKNVMNERLGRDPDVRENNIARLIYLDADSDGDLNAVVYRMTVAVFQYIARSVAVGLQALPNINYAKPVHVKLGTPTPTGSMRTFPAAMYQRMEDVERDVHTLYCVGMPPKYLLKIDHSRYEKYVVSHNPATGWDTVSDPQYAWAWSHGACWLASIYPEEVFKKIDDPLKPTKEFGRIAIEEIGWRDKP